MGEGGVVGEGEVPVPSAMWLLTALVFPPRTCSEGMFILMKVEA